MRYQFLSFLFSFSTNHLFLFLFIFHYLDNICKMNEFQMKEKVNDKFSLFILASD